MANRNGKGDVAHTSPPSGSPAAFVAPPSHLLAKPAPAQFTSLRPLPQRLAHRTFPKRHGADLRARFGEAVRAVRLLRAFSQHDLAARAGIHRTHISLIESGTREARLTTICTLAAALHVNPADLMPLLFLPDPPPSPPHPSAPIPPP